MDLDDAYNNLGYIPSALDFPPRWEQAAAAYRDAAQRAGRAHLGISYGKTARQTYDVFTPDGDQNGIAIFVHGGYWRRFDGSVFSHLAAGTVAHGWNTAVPSYDLCPHVHVSEITQQITAMVSHVAKQVPGPIVLAGHSAGGHLVARLLEPGRLPGPVAARVKSVVPISPVADLRPLLRTTINADLRLTPDEAERESPVLMTQRIDANVHVWVGADERPAFLDQARWLSDAWMCPLRIASGKHHLNVIDALADPASEMVADILPPS